MKKKLAIMMAGIMMISMLSLVGCGGSDNGGSTDSAESEKVVFESQTFMFGDWEITTTDDAVLFDEVTECDHYLLYFTAKNTSDKSRAISVDDNIWAYQHDESLYWSWITDENDEVLTSDYDVLDQEVEPGEKVDLVYGWELEDDSTVTVYFRAFTVDIETTEWVVEVKDRITTEWKDVQEAEKAAIEEKKNATEFDIVGASAELVDGWYIDESYEDEVKLVREGEAGYIRIECADWGKTAQEEAEELAGNFNMDVSSITTVEIGDVEFVCLPVLDDQVYLFTESSEGVVSVNTMFYTLDAVMNQIDAMTIK